MLPWIIVVALVRTAYSTCNVDVQYDFSAGVSPNVGTGYMQMNPASSVATGSGVAIFTGSGTLQMYKFSAVDWQGDRAFSFNFQPPNPSLVADVSVISNDITNDAGSLMITWSANQVKLKVILRLWNSTTLQFDERTEMLTVSGVNLGGATQVRFAKNSTHIEFQAGPLVAGGYPSPLSLSLKHDEAIKIVGWDPLTVGTGTATKFNGFFDNFSYYQCTPSGFFL